jgi:two-component system NtrC family sensor kinase
MANTYNIMEDYERAESTFLKALDICKKVKLNIVELYAYSNLATLYIDQERWQESYEYGMKAADLGATLGDHGIESASLAKASTALVNMDQAEKALTLSRKAIDLADESKVPLNIYQAYSSMGYALMSQGSYEEAIPFYEKGLAAMEDADIYAPQIGRMTKELSECYERIGNPLKALELYKTSTEITDSVSRKENIRKATELTMNFEFEQKALTAKAIQDAKDEITCTRQVAMTIGLVLSLLLIAGALRAYLSKQKANVVLVNQKKELEATLNKLKETQAQLIQSEKMASLGELTAGIAHEIQNPLNFVNNFSEVSEELIGEVEEERAKTPEQRNEEVISSILGELKENLRKINHHGKRAGSIVRGMLDHSRTHTGEKIATDLNQLADECLRLSYHGLRAKDKSFHAEFRTDFDPNLPKVKVIPQDVGRVLLNIINNAFYACTKGPSSSLPASSDGEPKTPLVVVSTKFLGEKVQISISDNGFGIPDSIKNKIFQPFFTTKPTGEGTGLGLSLL